MVIHYLMAVALESHNVLHSRYKDTAHGFSYTTHLDYVTVEKNRFLFGRPLLVAEYQEQLNPSILRPLLRVPLFF
jgi:hypothetical protein